MKDKEKQYISMKEMLTKRSFETVTNCNCVEETRYAVRKNEDNASTMTDLLNQEIEELQKALKEKQIEEMAIQDMARVFIKASCKGSECEKCLFIDSVEEAQECCVCLKAFYNAGYRKIDKDKDVVLSKEELKRLETNYKIGLGKSQSWCKSLKNRIEELEKENFKLKVENEVLKDEKEQFENDVCNYEMNLQHLTGELENKSKETAKKIYRELQGHGTTYVKKWIEKQFGVEIKE